MSHKIEHQDDGTIKSIFTDTQNKSYQLIFKRIQSKLYVDFYGSNYWNYCADYNSVVNRIVWKSWTITNFLVEKNCHSAGIEAHNWFDDLTPHLALFMKDNIDIPVGIV
jgi:hypothetical protein